MSSALSTDSIRLHQKRGGVGAHPHESVILLSAKLNELFNSGYGKDDIFGIVIPLLMQGKIRINLGKESERLELEDKELRLQRSAAVQVFETYLEKRGHVDSAPIILLPRPRD